MFDELRDFKLLYVGSPYRKFKLGMGQAAKQVAKITARLTISGLPVYSPIAHGHMLSIYGGIHPSANELWEKINSPFMEMSGAIVVAKMDGWEESDGLADEIRQFQAVKKPVFYLDPHSLLVSNAA